MKTIFPRYTRTRWPRSLLCLPALVSLVAPSIQAGVSIDASAPAPVPQALSFSAGATSPDGHVLAINSRYFTFDNLPWFPVMGEFHYARYPAGEWERELRKMKAGGINIVATYVFWIFHEEQKDRFDWSGQRDLRLFVQTCAKLGLKVWLRVGPWDHGEVRNGGLPDWLLDGPKRESAPAYLDRVQQFYTQIGEQARGLFWRDGGPIVGVQIENEYHPEQGGEAHMTKLLELARAAGLDAPFYTATGWDKATIPPSQYLPVFGGYTEQFWSDSLGELPPNQNFFFTRIRAEDNVGHDLQPKDKSYDDRYAGYPFLTAEMGGGMAVAYHRRPVMRAADSTSAALVKLGSGVTALGYYMYHGGTNPDGRTTLHETLDAWNGYQDIEVKSYDFQAPLGEFGQFHESYRTMKTLNLFLNEFGGQLAPMTAYFPTEMPRSLDDTLTPRVAFRSDGKSGFVFINNYERNYRLAEHPDFQVELKLPSGQVAVPQRPTMVPGGVYAIWPVNLDLGPARLRYATAQLLCRLAAPDTYVFFSISGVKPEFLFEPEPGSRITAARARVAKEGAGLLVTDLESGRDAAISIRYPDGKVTEILLLSQTDALNLWKAGVAGRERLLLSPAGLYFDRGQVHLEADAVAQLKVAVFPAIESEVTGFKQSGTTGLFSEYVSELTAQPALLATVRKVKAAAPVPPVRLHADPKRRVARAPEEAAFAQAAVWSIQVPAALPGRSSRALLRISYQGDVARLYAGDRLLEDNYYKGPPLNYGLWRLSADELRAGLTLKILPLRQDAPIYLPPDARPKFAANGEALALDEVRLEWIYDAVLAP